MSDDKEIYVDWSKAPEGTTQVCASNLTVNGTPLRPDEWEKVYGEVVYKWQQEVGGWKYFAKECNIVSKRIKRTLNTEPTKQTLSVDVGDDIDLKRALDVIVAKYQGELVVWKDHAHEQGSHFKEAHLNRYQEDFNDYVSDLITTFKNGYYFEVVDRDEQRKKEIQDQIEKLKEELDGL